ncbi:TRAP transporter small permease [Nitratireductor aquibiodomus]|uniref:TRAP transporter small permease protein n=1 Tax=Nitratireductor aquibiodomus TaxID=204799 RepID=A0A1H4L795_9HYPH|nr:TRAP transporter small permease subunit [Nitratireductor aquibiodomus]SEB66052.1 TRAP-type C4-dicarboxylate transport system, small permease component [Nitratireductor aquibiodomus]
MAQNTMVPEIDFDAISAEDEAHFAGFKISLADYALLAIFLALFLVVFVQFFTRYVLNDSISWTEEAARYLLVILAFAGAVRCQITGSHIVLEFVDKYYGRKLGLVHVFSLLCTVALFTILLWSAWELIQRTSFQRMVSLPFPKYYLHAAVMALAGLNAVVAAMQLMLRVKQMIRS